MNITVKVILGVLIALGSFLVLVGTFAADHAEVMLIEFALGSLLKYLAILITITSGLLLLGKAATTGSIAKTLPLTVPAAIGLFILSPHWAIGIYLSVLAIGHFTQTILQAKDATDPPSLP